VPWRISTHESDGGRSISLSIVSVLDRQSVVWDLFVTLVYGSAIHVADRVTVLVEYLLHRKSMAGVRTSLANLR
jgi:hypothetical protein